MQKNQQNIRLPGIKSKMNDKLHTISICAGLLIWQTNF